MRYFEFLHGLRIIRLPLNISDFRKLHWQHLFENKEEAEKESLSSSLLMRCNTLTPWKTTSTFKQTGNTTIFSLGYQYIYLATFWSVLFKKTHVLVVRVELILVLFLNILSLNFVSTLKKSLRFKRFRRIYANRSAVVLIKVMLYFCLMCAVPSSHILFLCTCLCQMIVHLRNLFLLSTPVARMLLTQRWVSRQKDAK